MLTWKIGAVTVTRIVESESRIPYSATRPFLPDAKPELLKAIPWLFPHFVTPEGHLRMSVHALLVDAPGLRLIVDTCVGNDRARRITGGIPLQTDFLGKLSKAGWSRESVTAVVCTHLHVDHVGWNTMLDNDKWIPTFPNARYLIGRKEYEYWNTVDEGDQPAVMTDAIKPVFDAGLAQLVEMDHRLSKEIRLVPSMGHTPGHVSVMIESQGAQALITGDFMHHPCQIAHPEWTQRFDSDPAVATVTRQAMLEYAADQPILVIGTHFVAPTAGRIKREGAAFRFEV